ncbi:MAG TPA: energy transducer TonB [Gammaproteobacteria bacterium]|nr:energy transducer TonB [Gammaproteobacteria bacterium]
MSMRMTYFVLGSLLLHALVVTFWHDAPPAGPVAQNTFRITVLARRGNASSTPDSGSQPPREANTRPAATQAAGVAPASERIADNSATNTPPPVKTARNARLQVARDTSGGRSTEQAVKTPARENPAHTERAASATPDNAWDGQRMSLSARSGSTRNGQHELTSSAKHSRVLAALQKALFPRFNYPPLARRRGWEGRVNVGLRVEADGDLTRIHLVTSSGHALLDRAAVRNISELRNIPGAAQWLGDDDMDVVLPVLYQLVD